MSSNGNNALSYLDGPVIDIQNAKELVSIVMNPDKVFEVVTGLLGQNSEGRKLMAGRLLQASMKLELLTQLGREIKVLRDDGKIKEDYYATNKAQASFYEMLKFIDDEVPEGERFKAMKSIFLNGLMKGRVEKDQEVAYQLLKLCRQLSSMEILILRACYELKDEMPAGNSMGYGEWVDTVSMKVGYGLPELVSSADDHLVNLGLVSHRIHTDRSGIQPGSTFRLTNLGLRLCEHISVFNEKS